jgi:hypothetical protein
MSEATAIIVPSVTNGLICDSTDKDWYTFRLGHTGGRLVIDLTSLPADYDIFLKNYLGDHVTSSTHSGPSDERMVVERATGLTYYILIQGYQGAFDPSDSYRLEVQYTSPTPTRTRTPTRTPTVEPCYYDDFSEESGWPVADIPEARAYYAGGEYIIKIKQQRKAIWAKAPRGAGTENYIAQLDCRQCAGTGGTYGIIFDFHRNHDDTFYVYLVDPWTREYALLRKDPNRWQVLKGLTRSSYINSGSSTNVLRVVRTASQICAWVNGQHLVTLFDGTYREGSAGAYAESLTQVPVSMCFDNFAACSAEGGACSDASMDIGVGDLAGLEAHPGRIEAAP